MPRIRVDNLVAGQIVIFKAYRTMTVFCGVDHSRIKSILLWSENSGTRWITEEWFSGRYSILVIEDEEIKRDKDKRVYGGLAYSELWKDLPMSAVVNPKTEEVKRVPSRPPKLIEKSILEKERTQSLFRRAVNEAAKKFESGEIKIPVYSIDWNLRVCCLQMIIFIIFLILIGLIF